MNCDAIRDLMEGPAAPDAALLRLHAEQCAGCAARIARFTAEEAAVRAAVVRSAARRLLEAARRRRRRSLAWGVLWGAAAAALLAILILPALRPKEPPPTWRVDGVATAGSWIEAAKPVLLERTGHVRAKLMSGSARALDGAVLELKEGRLEVAVVSGSGPLVVRTPAGDVRAAAAALSIVADPRETMIVLHGGAAVVSAGGHDRDLASGLVVTLRLGEPPEAPVALAERLGALETEVVAARDRATQTERERDRALKGAAQLSQSVRDVLASGDVDLLKRLSQSMDRFVQDADSPRERMRLSALRQKRLPPEAIEWLGLDVNGEKVVNDLLRREGEQLVAMARRLAAEEPPLKFDESDESSLLAAFMPEVQASWERIPARLRPEPPSEPETEVTAPQERPTVYLQDYVPASNRALRFLEAIRTMRDATLEEARRTLTPSQLLRLSALLRYDVALGNLRVFWPMRAVRPKRGN